MAKFIERELELQGLLDGSAATAARKAQQATGLTQVLAKEQVQRAVDTHGRESGPSTLVRREGSGSVLVRSKVLDFGVVKVSGEGFAPYSFKPAFNDDGAPNFTRSEVAGSELQGDVALLSIQMVPPEKQTFRIADGDGVDLMKPSLAQKDPLYRFIVEKPGTPSKEVATPVESAGLVGAVNPKQVLEGVVAAVKAAKLGKA